MRPTTLHDLKTIRCTKDIRENIKSATELKNIIASDDTERIIDSINCANEMLVNIIKRLNELEDHVYSNLK